MENILSPKKIMLTLLAGTTAYNVQAGTPAEEEEKPNFLFLVIEDTSPYLFPQYGNENIDTPNLDFFEDNGVVFTRAYANAPQCSPARSSLISGSYATTYGNDWHRNNHIVPQEYFFPQYLREAGYFTVNAGKTDYNITKKMQRKFYDKSWDKMSGYQWRSGEPNVSYNDDAREGRPFFAQFNNMTTHMSRMTTVSINNRKPPEINPDSVDLPPHVPDLPAIRSDYAEHLESIEEADRWVGIFMKDLKERELLNNTIVFFFSDHGGCLPRGKAFGYNTGYQAALMVYAPSKWQHLLPADPGTTSDRLVEFADFGPTLLSAAGVKPPDHLQGKPFMGDYEEKPREYAFNFRTNTGNHFDPSRSVYTEKFQYIKFYTPYKIHALRQGFQWGMPAQLAWDSLFMAGRCLPKHRPYYEEKPREMLFDIQNDPFCLSNLADNPGYISILKNMRSRLSGHIRQTKDLGFFPHDVRDHLVSQDISLYEWVRKQNYSLDLLYELVEKASRPSVEDVENFSRLLHHQRPEIRFWAASGLAYLFQQRHYSEVPENLHSLIDDTFGSVSAKAATALVYAGETGEGINALVDQASEGNMFAWSSLENLGAIVKPWLPEILELSRNSGNGNIRFQARSILINFGELQMHDLFEEGRINNFVNGHKKKVNNPIPTWPYSK